MPKQIRVTNVTCFGAKDKKGCDERTSQPPYYINRRILIILIEESSIGINQCGNLLELCVDKFRLTVQLLTLTV